MKSDMVCPVCHVSRKLVAVETREYHAHCDNCKFGKWTGQSEEYAQETANKHYRHVGGNHRIHVDYAYQSDSYQTIHKTFGRRVKKYISDDIWHEQRVNSHRGSTITRIPFLPGIIVEITMKADEDESDTPPF